MLRPREQDIEVRGLKIHYLEWGERTDEPLILIHGFLDHARSWEPLVACLVKNARAPLWIIAPDCRGHGDSGWIGKGGYYHFPDYVQDLDALIDHLEVPAVKLVGHSMGGTISFLYAGTFPQRITKMVLVEGVGPIGSHFSEAPDRMRQWISEVRALRYKKPREYSAPEEAARALQRKNPRLAPDLTLCWARAGMKQTANGTWVWKFDPLHRTVAPQPFYTAQSIEFFRRIECPVLLVQGKESRQTPRPDARQRLDAIANRRMVEIEAAAHMVHLDNPEALAKAVADFMNH